AWRHPILFGCARGLDRFVHLAVPRTAAQVPAKCAANFILVRLWIYREQMLYSHDEARRAETALCAAPIAISLLDRGQAAVFAHAFNGCDLESFTTGGQHRARKHWSAIDLYRASSAGRIVTSALCAGKLQVSTQCVQQERARLDSELMSTTVNPKFDEFFFHSFASG